MKTMHPTPLALTVIATAALAAMSAPCAQAGDLIPEPAVEAVELLVPPDDLDDVSLSIVDEKLAMSLAVEAHVHCEMIEYALGSVHDDELKQLLAKKLRVYRALYNTLDDLTGGRADSMLAKAARGRDHNQAASNDDQSAQGDALSGGTATGVTNSVASESTRTATTQVERKRPAKRNRRGGLSNILQNATTSAILRVRLEIAEQYAALLHAELATAPAGEFDRRYIAIELYNQMQIVAMLRVFEQQASADFAKIIHVATVAAEDHVQDARQVVERMTNTLPLPIPPAQEVVNTADVSGM